MSKGDRRNFKLFARLQEGDKKYVQLFDAIDRQDEYDEAALLEQFKGERFTKQFSVAKNYLYNYILKTLHVFHKDQYAELITLMHQIQILMGKNLYDQASKMVRKAKHIAERQERFQEMLYLLGYEREILHRTVQTKQYEAFLAGIQEEELSNLAKINNMNQLNHLFDQIYTFRIVHDSARGEAELAEVDRILSDPLLSGPEKALSTRGRLRQLDILIECTMANGDSEASLRYSNEVVSIYENSQEIRTENNTRYINTVSNLGVFNYLLGKPNEAVSVLNKLKSLEIFGEREQIRVFEKYYSFKMALCIELCDVREGVSTLAEFVEEMEKMEGLVSKSFELGIYYSAGYFHLQRGEPSEALVWVNKILNEPKTELRSDLQCMARILNLVIHLELGNKDFVELNIKSTTRFLVNRNRLFKYERSIIKHLRNLANPNPNEGEEQSLSAFKECLEEMSRNPVDTKASALFDALTWVNAQLAGQSMFAIRRLEEEAAAVEK